MFLEIAFTFKEQCFFPPQTIAESAALEKSVLSIGVPSASPSEKSSARVCLPITIPLSQRLPASSKEGQQRLGQSVSKQGSTFDSHLVHVHIQ